MSEQLDRIEFNIEKLRLELLAVEIRLKGQLEFVRKDIKGVQNTLAARERNAIARELNSKWAHKQLEPLYSVWLNKQLPNFPRTITEFNSLPDANIRGFLAGLGDHAARRDVCTPDFARKRLTMLVGIVHEPDSTSTQRPQAGQGQAVPGQVGPGQAGLGPAGLGQAGLGQVVGLGQAGPGQANPFQFDLGQAGPFQFDLGQAGPGQFDLGQAGPGQFDLGQAGLGPIGLGQVKVKVKPVQVNLVKVKPAKAILKILGIFQILQISQTCNMWMGA
ncbi:hypothetical protein F4777DRAFT_597202 [Nemania sp. FL0916]|nr:hypothetical protein F4777DRAFT_597202 [Nemania sp. FL0916]